MVLTKLRMQCHAQQTALIEAFVQLDHLRTQIQEQRVGEFAVLAFAALDVMALDGVIAILFAGYPALALEAERGEFHDCSS